MRSCLLAIGVLLLPVAVSAQDDCKGKNPHHCGVRVSSQDGEVVEMPPGGCEGKNPRFCRETAPRVEPQQEEPERKERAAADSRNEGRNPNKNPNANPNRRSRRRGGTP